MEDFFNARLRELEAEKDRHKETYRPLVRRISDLEFAGLNEAVAEERARRIARLIQENPMVRRLAIEQLVGQLKAEEDEKN